jgi:transposase
MSSYVSFKEMQRGQKTRSSVEIMKTSQRYSSDLTDGQWDRLSHLVPQPKKGGRPAKYARRDVANALLFVNHNRCSWRSLPGDLTPWRIAYWYYTTWKKSGVFDRLLAEIKADEYVHSSSEAAADFTRD